MIRTIIIDDEELCINALQSDIETHCPDIEIVAIGHSAREGILAIHRHKPELVFLDVSMPWMNGFELLELTRGIPFRVIFVTSYDQYAIRALRLSAVDYLLKPVDPVDLRHAVEKIRSMTVQPTDPSLVDNLLTNMKLPDAQHKIAVPIREGYELIDPHQILFCEAEGAYTKMHLKNETRVMLISKSLGDIEDMIPATQFQRIHHSTIVNVDYVTHFIKTDGGYVQMINGKRLMVSKTRKEALLRRLGLSSK